MSELNLSRMRLVWSASKLKKVFASQAAPWLEQVVCLRSLVCCTGNQLRLFLKFSKPLRPDFVKFCAIASTGYSSGSLCAVAPDFTTLGEISLSQWPHWPLPSRGPV